MLATRYNKYETFVLFAEGWKLNGRTNTLISISKGEREREIYIRVDVINNYDMSMGGEQNSLSSLSKTTATGKNIIHFDYFNLFAALG